MTSTVLANYTTTYAYDLAGNRDEKQTDQLGDSTIDETVTYNYDDNDRLTSDETHNGSNTLVRSTTYEYGGAGNPWTQQTKKTETDHVNNVVKVTDSTYNRQGRLSKVEIDDNFNTSPGYETTIDYEYNDQGIRVAETVNTIKTRYLVDANNHTGYQQVLEAWKDQNSDGIRQASELTSYLLGHDIINQWNQADGVLYMLYDGHGSNRGLVDAMGEPLSGQIYTYDAYGNRIDSNNALTIVLHNGELLNTLTGNYYNRARFYNPVTGRFNRLDPFAGNYSDPQSLHKYLFAHGDPVNGIDPTGLSLLTELKVSITINAVLASITTAAYGTAKNWSASQIAWASAFSAGIAIGATFGFFAIASSFALAGVAAATRTLAATLIVGPSIFGLVVANFVKSMESGDEVDKLFAFLDLALSIAAVRATGRNLTGQHRAIAEAHVERIRAIKLEINRGVAGAMTDGNFVTTGRSTTAQASRQKLDPVVEAMYAAIKNNLENAPSWTGKCAEGFCASNAPSLSSLRGAWSAAVNIGKGNLRSGCESCTEFFRMLGINDAFIPDYGPLRLIIWSMMGASSDYLGGSSNGQ